MNERMNDLFFHQLTACLNFNSSFQLNSICSSNRSKESSHQKTSDSFSRCILTLTITTMASPCPVPFTALFDNNTLGCFAYLYWGQSNNHNVLGISGIGKNTDPHLDGDPLEQILDARAIFLDVLRHVRPHVCSLFVRRKKWMSFIAWYSSSLVWVELGVVCLQTFAYLPNFGVRNSARCELVPCGTKIITAKKI